MSGDALYGKCSICGKESELTRIVNRYDFKCECHSPTHFESYNLCEECVNKHIHYHANTVEFITTIDTYVAMLKAFPQWQKQLIPNHSDNMLDCFEFDFLEDLNVRFKMLEGTKMIRITCSYKNAKCYSELYKFVVAQMNQP